MDFKSSEYYSRVYGDYILVYRPIAARKTGENQYQVLDADREDTLLEKDDLVGMCDRPSSTGGIITCVDFVYTNAGFHRYIIDGTIMADETSFHEEIARVLHVFDGYGMNLDALWDVLRDSTGLVQTIRPVELVWVSSSYARTRLARYDQLVGLIEQAFAGSGDKLVLA